MLSTETLHADYLVIGAGAMGMAFTDVILTETDATVVIIDRRSAPGGHWNDAYPFVHLHQPSAFYGVNSTELGSGRIDTFGPNEGLYELASGPEVVSYFDQVMRRQFIESGRVQFFPMSDHSGGSAFTSLVSGQKFEVDAGTVVDARYMNVTVPATRDPDFAVADDARCVPVSQLPKHAADADRFVVVGAGKTGMDACLWLLDNGASADSIRWVMPRDSWLLDRTNIQPTGPFYESTVGGFAKQAEAVVESTSVPDMFARLETAADRPGGDANHVSLRHGHQA